MEIFFSAMAEEKRHTFECVDTPNRSFKYFEALKNKKELCDITLHVGGESISAHRVVISAVIPYFRNILISSKDEEDISMPSVDPNALKILIEFAYTCKVEIDEENANNLLIAACYLGVEVVRDACCDFFIDILEHDNVLNIRQLADTLNCSKLVNCADCYIKRNFEKISQTEKFLLCPSTYLKELIGKDDLNVDNEEKVLETVLKWVKSSTGERTIELPELMSKVRMTLLDPLYLAKLVEREQIIGESLLCRNLIDEAKHYVLFPELRKSTCSFVTESRNLAKTSDTSDQSDHQFICNLNTEIKFTVQHLDLVKNKWQTQQAKSFSQKAAGSAVVHKKIYFLDRYFTAEYDPANSGYRFLHPMTTPRLGTATTAVKNQIYVCGGYGSTMSICSNIVERFDPEKNEWIEMRSMKFSCSRSSSVALDDYIFILGGAGPKLISHSGIRPNSVTDSLVRPYDIVQRYDSVMDKWKTMSSLLTKRVWASAAVLNRKIYICGGYVLSRWAPLIVSATAEMYDPIDDKWTFISSMTSTRSNFNLLQLRGRLYALGGKNNEKKFVKFIDAYDPVPDKWIKHESINFDQDSTVVAVM